VGELSGDFPARIATLPYEEAQEQVSRQFSGQVFWSDGSRFGSGQVGAGVAWQVTESRWQTKEVPLGKGAVWGLRHEALEMATTGNGQTGPVRIFLP
jgi:hypothetical protein